MATITDIRSAASKRSNFYPPQLVVFEKAGNDYTGGTIYSVHATDNNELLGYVRKGERTWERRSAGRRYVNARGQTPTWFISKEYSTTFSGYGYDTRNEAARVLWNRS